MNRVHPDFLACAQCARRVRRFRAALHFLGWIALYLALGLAALWALGYIANTAPTLQP